jgi:hypothetical protein
MSRIKKFNNSNGAILCSKCRTIIKEGFDTNPIAVGYHMQNGTYPDGLITKEDWESNEPIYCEKCQEKMKNSKKK